MIILLKNENNLPVITSKVKKNVDYTDNFEFAVTTDVEIELEDEVRVRSNVVNQDYRVYEITSDGFEKRVFCKSVFFDSQDIVLDIPAVDSTDVSLWRFIARLNVYLSQKDTVFRVELDADEEKKISVEASRVTLYNLLFDEEKGLCKLYNLQVDWNDRVIYLRDHEKEGRNTEILFHENKNIASLDYNTNKKELITKLYVAATYKPSEEEKKRLKEEEKAKKEAEKANSTNGKKPLDEVARDVILGKYGNGRPRVDKLTKEGYDAKAVQKRVNELLKSGAWKNLSKEEKTTATTTEENYSTLANETTPITQPEEEKDIIFYTVYTSPIANQYSRIYEGTLDFDSEEISSQEKLEEWCKANLFNEKDTRDVPLTTYSFTPAQEDYRVDLFDKAKVKYTRIGIDKVVKCVEFEYDPQNDKYDVINFGSLKSNPREAEMKEVQGQLSSARKENAELRQSLLISEAEFERQLELDRLAFQLDFATSKEKIVSEVEEGVQEAKDAAAEYGANVRKDIDDAIKEATKDIPDLTAELEKAMGTAKSELRSQTETMISQIQFPDVGAIVDEKIRNIPKDPIKVGARNYLLETDVCVTEEQKNFELAFNDFDTLRGKEITISADVETVNASGRVGEFERNGIEVYIRFEDNSTFWPQVWNHESNFKGRIAKTISIPDKKIMRIGAYVQNKFANGKSVVCKPMLEISNTPSDWRPAQEDNKGYIDNEFAEYKQDLEGRYTVMKGIADGASNVSNEAKETALRAERKMDAISPKFDEQGKLIELKNFESSYSITAKEIEKKLSTMQTFIDDEGNRKDEIMTAVSTDTADKLKEERKYLSDNFMAKNELESTADSIKSKLITEVVTGDNEITKKVNEAVRKAGESENSVNSIKLKVDNLNPDARNYVLDSEREVVNSQFNSLRLANFDLQLLRGKTVTLSVDVETRNASGTNGYSEGRAGWEPAIEFEDGSVQWLMNWTNQSTFKGRIYNKYKILDKPIKKIHRILMGSQFKNGEVKVSKPMFNIGDIKAPYTVAWEDIKNEVISMKTSRSQTESAILDRVSRLEDDTFKYSDFELTEDGFRLQTGLEENGSMFASMIAADPESIKMISDQVVVTNHTENLIKDESNRTYTQTGYRDHYLTDWIENSGNTKIEPGDEFLLSGIVTNSDSSHISNFIIQLQDDFDGNKWQSAKFATPGMNFTDGRQEATIKIERMHDSYLAPPPARYRLGINIDAYSNHGSYGFQNLSIVKKKDANFIVEGTIRGKHIKGNSINSDHIEAGSIKGRHIEAQAITSNHIQAESITADKLAVNQATIDKLKASKVFTDYLESRTIDASKINGGVIKANVAYQIGDKGNIKPFETGVRFTVPENRSSNYGVGFQVSGKIDGKINKGINVYKLNDFSSPNNPKQEYNDTLLTVHGQILAGFKFEHDLTDERSNQLGLVVCSNRKNNTPVFLKGFGNSTLTPIHGLNWGWGGNLSGHKIVFTYGEANNFNTFMVNVAQSFSDSKLKENIKDSKVNAIDFVSKLKFKEFSWKQDISEVMGMKDIPVGLIAQDVEELDEALVSDSNKYKELEYNRLTMYNMKATQELIEENKELKSRIARLEEIVAQLIDEK